MLTYIYFVKCPGCEDEPFDFFNDAKECAMCQLSKKPVITQVEVNRNDFGECTDSCDLGTVWSWEDVMTDDEPAKSIFTKDDLKRMDDGKDPEFDEIDNSVDFDFRKPVPEDMSIEDLVEAMEENEDEVECALCNELFPKAECHYDEEEGYICAQCEEETVKCTWCGFHYDPSECRKEVDMGWLCSGCESAIKSRGETLTFKENNYWDFLDEEFEADDNSENLEEAVSANTDVEFEYTDLKVTLQGKKRDADDWDEAEDTVSHTFTKSRDDVATDIWENFITEEDVKDVEGGLEALEDDAAWDEFLSTHFDDLVEKYQDKLLDYYRTEAAKEYEETHSLGESCKSFLEELEEAVDYRARLADCPECGFKESYDHETGICINCGFNI
jgi:hypothetical protein